MTAKENAGPGLPNPEPAQSAQRSSAIESIAPSDETGKPNGINGNAEGDVRQYSAGQLRTLRQALGPLADRPIFTVWWSVPDGEKKPRKKPLHPAGTEGMTFAEALQLYRINAEYSGLGVKFGPIPGQENLCLWGMDFDEGKGGQPPECWRQAPSYREVSPSGQGGFHALALFEGKPLEGKKPGCCEIYMDGRFFTLTGNRLEGSSEQIVQVDPLPFYAAIGCSNPQPYGSEAATMPNVAGAQIAEAELTERERSIGEAVRGITNDDESDRDHAVACDAMRKGASDEEAVRILCAYFWREKLGRKDYLARTIARARSVVPKPNIDFTKMLENMRQAAAQKAANQQPQNDAASAPAAQQHVDEAKKPSRFQIESVEEAAAKPIPPYIVKKTIPASSIGLIVGSSKAGKSFLLSDLLRAIGTGSRWFGLRTHQGRCLHIVLEGHGGFTKRMRAMLAKGMDCTGLRSIRTTLDLRDSIDRQELIDTINASADGPFAVIGIDTLNRAGPGSDENNSLDMGALIAAMADIQQQTGATVIAVHHFGKDELRGPRGHTSLLASLDFMLEAHRTGRVRSWCIGKAKDDDDSDVGHPFELEVVDLGTDEDDDPITSCVVAPSEGSEAQKASSLPPQPSGANQRLVLAALRRAATSNSIGGPLSWKVGTLDEAIGLGAQALTCEAKRRKSNARQIINALLDAGLLRRDGEEIWLAI